MNSGFLWPVSGKITSPFGKRSKPTAGASSDHMGVDISVPQGTTVKSALYGVVKQVGYAKDAGNFVVIDHGDGLITKYQHLLNSAVKAGDAVLRGQSIAKSGNSGRSTGPHLHFAMMKDGRPIDPQSYTHTPKTDKRPFGISTAATNTGVVALLEQYWYVVAGGLIVVALISKLGR